jgi:glycosyltransferase involved in cell wall biosynthesis
MKIILISNLTPTADNCRAASALSYHLIKYRPVDVEMEIYSFNSNRVELNRIKEIEQDLHVKIYEVPRSRLVSWMFRLHLVFLKNFLPYPFDYYNRLSHCVVAEIKTKHPDGIWINGDSLSIVAKQFPEYQRVHTMPDCVPLYYHRLMGDDFLFHSLFRMVGNCVQYYKNIKMEREYAVDNNIHYHLVGEADSQYLMKINPNIKAHFIRHPHYNITNKKIIKFSQPKIKVLIAGQYNLYMKTAFDDILPALNEHHELAEHYSITFLGKGWDFAVERLMAAGYESKRLGFVDVYLDEIIKYDIQLTPISVGTGTKGKVLDALANGLMVIGTPYAMENIAVENCKSCIVYEMPEQLIDILNDIPNNLSYYEEITDAGRVAVRKFHDRATVSEQLFQLFRNN